MTTETNDTKPELCPDCGAELHRGDCPVCDPWSEDDFDDDFEGEN